MDMRSKTRKDDDRGGGASTRSAASESSSAKSTPRHLVEDMIVIGLGPDGKVRTDEAYCKQASQDLRGVFDAKDIELDGRITTRAKGDSVSVAISSKNPADMSTNQFALYMSNQDMKEKLKEVVVRSNDPSTLTDRKLWKQMTREVEYYAKEVDRELKELELPGLHESNAKCNLLLDCLSKVGSELPNEAYTVSGHGLRR